MKAVNRELERSKTRARSILARLKALGFGAGLQQSFEVLAATEGYRDWATMKASISSGPKRASNDDNTRTDHDPVCSEDNEQYSDLVREMMVSSGNSVQLNAKVYEALGYMIEWKMCQPDMFDAFFDDTKRSRPFILSRPALVETLTAPEPLDRRAEAKRRIEIKVNGDLMPITMSLDGGVRMFNGLKVFEGCSLSMERGPNLLKATITTPLGRRWTSTAKTEAMALCVTMVRMMERNRTDPGTIADR